jgi:hypothetical protein
MMQALWYLKPSIGLAAITLGSLQPLAGSELMRQEVDNLKAVCRMIVGIEDWRVKEVFRQQLRPYISSMHALEQSSVLECSFHCGGTLKLRGDADIYYGFSNQPPNVTHRVDTVALHVHGKRVLAIGPGTEYYPYPYYQAEHKK